MKLSNLWRKKKVSPYGFFPGYATWDEALRDSTSYTAPAIIAGTLKRREINLANFDAKDSHVEENNQHLLLLSALAFILTKSPQSSVKVLDYGGSFALYYYLLRRSLPHVTFDWTVIETKELAEAHKVFEEPQLRWQTSLPPVSESGTKAFDLCLASSSLPYIPNPYEVLEKLAKLGRFAVVTRMPLIKGDSDRVAVQRVPPEIFDASYPAWLFSRERFLIEMKKWGDVRLSWNAGQDAFKFEGEKIAFKGYLLETF